MIYIITVQGPDNGTGFQGGQVTDRSSIEDFEDDVPGYFGDDTRTRVVPGLNLGPLFYGQGIAE